MPEPLNQAFAYGTGPRTVTAPHGTDLNTKGWLQEAVLRSLLNNLDPQVAEIPEELVVYGGRGKAARNWESFDAIVKTLTELENEWKITGWRTQFLPTRKNQQVCDFWERAGFSLLTENDGCKQYAISTNNRQRYNKTLIDIQQE